jgi:hypothetical protein
MADQMLYAKHHPGQIEAPFINNGEMTSLRTGIVKNQLFLSTAIDLDNNLYNLTPIGSRSYVIIALCTAFSTLPATSA